MDSKVYVFDMDDTLVDTHLRYEEIFLKILEEEDISYDADTLLPVLNPLGVSRTAAYYGKLGVSGTAEEIFERMLTYMQRFYTSDKVQLMPCAEELLRRLKAEGARLFVLTATSHRFSDACLREKGIYSLFERVWCTEDFGMTKGQVALFERVAQEIGCQPQDIFYIDDGVTAIRTAREAGLYTCGYLAPFAVESDGMEQAAHTCIHSFEELL